MSPYPQDPGGNFTSSAHRKVLGHLSLPNDDYGWSLPQLIVRMVPDPEHSITDPTEMDGILGDLEGSGYAERVNVNNVDIWRMTQSGFDLISGRIANEPPPGAAVVGPAMLTNIPGAGGSTKFDTQQAEPTEIGQDQSGGQQS